MLNIGLGKVANALLRPFGREIRSIVRDEQPPLRPPRELGQSYFTECRVFSSRVDLVSALPKGREAAEIGVADGDFSAQILGANSPAKLHLIDPWDSERYRAGLERVQARFAPEIASGRVVLHRTGSLIALASMRAASLDWVYLNTFHDYETTAKELEACAPVLRPDGYLAGHDFCIGNPHARLPFGVIEAVYEFCQNRNWQFSSVALDGDGYFSFCLKRA